ncbi:MAG: twin-arginine translocase subunit TatC [Candidatus Hodarchaeota archaeon]
MNPIVLSELESRLPRPGSEDRPPHDFQATMVEHTEELFRRLRLIAIAIVFTSFLVALLPQAYLEGDFTTENYEPAIYLELKWLIDWSTSQIHDREVKIILGSPVIVLLAYIELALIIGTILNIPFISYQLYQFMRPGLYDEELILIRRVSMSFSILFFFGAIVGWLLVPPMMRALVGISSTLELEGDMLLIYINLESLINYIFFSVLVAGLIHTYPVFIIFLVLNGVFTSEDLRTRRREVIAGLLSITAVITPDPTPFSMIVMAVPLILLYEITINVTMKVERSTLYANLMERYGKSVPSRIMFTSKTN